MWIRMLRTAAGPKLEQTFEEGKVYEVTKAVGEEWIREGAAERHVPKHVPAETAAVGEGERATEPKPEEKDSIFRRLANQNDQKAKDKAAKEAKEADERERQRERDDE
jgi:hypothetical protein